MPLVTTQDAHHPPQRPRHAYELPRSLPPLSVRAMTMSAIDADKMCMRIERLLHQGDVRSAREHLRALLLPDRRWCTTRNDVLQWAAPRGCLELVAYACECDDDSESDGGDDQAGGGLDIITAVHAAAQCDEIDVADYLCERMLVDPSADPTTISRDFAIDATQRSVRVWTTTQQSPLASPSPGDRDDARLTAEHQHQLDMMRFMCTLMVEEAEGAKRREHDRRLFTIHTIIALVFMVIAFFTAAVDVGLTRPDAVTTWHTRAAANATCWLAP